MQALVITTRLPSRHITARLQINLPQITTTTTTTKFTHEEVQLPSPSAARACDDSISLERPARGGAPGPGAAGRQRQRLVRGAVRPDRQVRATIGALDRPARDVEVLAARLGAHDRDRGCGTCQFSYFLRPQHLLWFVLVCMCGYIFLLQVLPHSSSLLGIYAP